MSNLNTDDVDELNFTRLKSSVSDVLKKNKIEESDENESDSKNSNEKDKLTNKTVNNKLDHILMYLMNNDKKINTIDERLKKTELMTNKARKEAIKTRSCKRIATVKAMTYAEI